MERKNNFVDPDTGDEVFISRYSVVQTGDGNSVYKDKRGKEIVNTNGKPMVFIPMEVDGDISFSVGRYGMMSREDQKKSLKERSKDHAKKHLSEYIQHVDKYGHGRD